MDHAAPANFTPSRAPSTTTYSRYPFSGVLFLAAQLLVLVAVVVRPSPFRPFLFIPILLIYWHLIFHSTTGNIAKDNAIGSVLATHLFTALDYVVLTDVQRELRKKRNKKDGDVVEDISNAPFQQRLIWGLKLMAAARGVGWEHEPTRYIRPGPKPGTSRIGWIIRELARLTVLLFIYDLANTVARWKVMTLPDPTTFLCHPWTMRFIGAASYGVPGLCAIDMCYGISGILSVSLGLSKPEEWPPLFGDFREAYTVRRFWTRGWHQMLRRPLLSHAKFITHHLLGLKPNTPLSRYLYLCLSFSTSAIIHQLGERMMYGNWTGTSYFFFCGQAVAITVEEIVIAMGRHFSINSNRNALLWRIVGYVWVASWLTYALDPVMSEAMVRYNDHFSIILGVWRGEWLPKVE